MHTAADDLTRLFGARTMQLDAAREPELEGLFVETEPAAEHGQALQFLEGEAHEILRCRLVEAAEGLVAEHDAILGVEQGEAVEQHRGRLAQEIADPFGLAFGLLELAVEFLETPALAVERIPHPPLLGDILEDAEIARDRPSGAELGKPLREHAAHRSVRAEDARLVLEFPSLGLRALPDAPPFLPILGVEDEKAAVGIEGERLGCPPHDAPELGRPVELAPQEVVVPVAEAGDPGGEFELAPLAVAHRVAVPRREHLLGRHQHAPEIPLQERTELEVETAASSFRTGKTDLAPAHAPFLHHPPEIDAEFRGQSSRGIPAVSPQGRRIRAEEGRPGRRHEVMAQLRIEQGEGQADEERRRRGGAETVREFAFAREAVEGMRHRGNPDPLPQHRLDDALPQEACTRYVKYRLREPDPVSGSCPVEFQTGPRIAAPVAEM